MESCRRSRKPSERREDLAAGWEGSVWKTTMRVLGLWEMSEVYHQPSGVASMSVRISLSLVPEISPSDSDATKTA